MWWNAKAAKVTNPIPFINLRTCLKDVSKSPHSSIFGWMSGTMQVKKYLAHADVFNVWKITTCVQLQRTFILRAGICQLGKVHQAVEFSTLTWGYFVGIWPYYDGMQMYKYRSWVNWSTPNFSQHPPNAPPLKEDFWGWFMSRGLRPRHSVVAPHQHFHRAKVLVFS